MMLIGEQGAELFNLSKLSHLMTVRISPDAGGASEMKPKSSDHPVIISPPSIQRDKGITVKETPTAV